MERDKMNKRIGLMRTIDHKRTISSEQSHYHNSQRARKFTLENCEPKKHSRQLTMNRKNQSLPKTLMTINQNIHTRHNHQRSIRSRKFVTSQSQFDPEEKEERSSEINLLDYRDQKGERLSEVMKKGKQLFEKQYYREASSHFYAIIRTIEEKCEEAVYLLGVCQLQTGEVDKAVLHLMKCLQNGYNFQVDVLETLSELFDRTKNYISALSTLDAWARKQPSAKCFLMRARIHYHFKDFEKAISDYVDCYRLDHDKLEAYIEEAEATYYKEGIEEALKKYNNLLLNYKTLWPNCTYSDINYIKYRKSLLLILEKRYKPAEEILKQISNPELQSEVNYYIGTIHGMLGNFEEALISFCRAIQSKTSLKFVAQSYYEKFVLMFKKNDFYGIQHEIDLLNIEDDGKNQSFKRKKHKISEEERNYSSILLSEPLTMIRKLVAGVIYILKMDFKSGILELGELKQNKYFQKNEKVFRQTVLSFRIFAFYSLHEFSNALSEFQGLHGKRLPQSNLYNQAMLKSINFCLKNDFNSSLKFLDEAESIEPFNTHTWAVKAIVEIIFYNSLKELQDRLDKNEKERGKEKINKETKKTLKKLKNDKKDYSLGEDQNLRESEMMDEEESEEMNEEILYSAEELLNRCLLKEPENDQLLYLISVISYELNQFESGLKVIRKAIEASDDHTVKHYYLKGNLKVMLGLHEEAISDYSNAILVMNETQSQGDTTEKQAPIPECYLERAKCYILCGSKEKAESDLRQFFSTIQNVKKHKDELDLFMHVGSNDVILEIYRTILEQKYNLWGKMKCYYLNKQLNSCLHAMKGLLEENKGEKNEALQKLAVDKTCLESLKKSSQGSKLFINEALDTFEEVLSQRVEGEIFKKGDILFFCGVLSFHSEDYQKAKNYFIDSKGEKLLKEELQQNQEEQVDEMFENQTYSLDEINYDIGICDLVQGKWSPYLDEHEDFKKFHQGVTEDLLQPEEITPFPIKNRLCSIYSPEESGKILYRLSFCLPKIQLCEVKFEKNEGIMKSIGFKDIDMRPSAPWIEKSKKGIVFTDQEIKESIDLKSEKSKKHNQRVLKKSENRYRNEDI